MSHGIADERAFFYGATGLLRWHNARRWPDSEWTDIGEQFRKSGLQVVPVTTAGVIPYHAGPKVYALDVGALGDPLLARLRLPPTPSLRPGHYFRLVPAGYVETLSTGENRIQDPKLARYYERLRTVVRGKLWSVQRMKDIV